jgi:hypothetical protein
MLERLSRAIQKKTIDNETPRMKAIGNQQMKIRDSRKIMDENIRMLKRLQEVPSVYDHERWEEDAKMRQKYIENMSEFSPQNVSYAQLPSPIKRPLTSSPIKLLSTNEARGSRSRPTSVVGHKR